MISLANIEAMRVITKNLDFTGAVIQPAPNSVIENIYNVVNRTRGIKDFNEKVYKDPSKIDFNELSNVAYLLCNGEDNDSEMNIKLNELTQAMATAARNNIQLAKTTVIPQITQITDMVTEKVNKAMGSDGLALEIDYALDNPVVNNAALKEVLSKYSKSPYKDCQVKNYHKERDTKQILDLLVTGKSDFDSDIYDYYKDNADLVGSVYYNIFLMGNQSIGQDVKNIYDVMTDFNSLLLIFLMARGLVQSNQVDETIKMRLTEYQSNMFELIDYVGYYLYIQLKIYNEALSTRRLVVRYPQTNKAQGTSGLLNRILVVKEVYEEYLAQGGKPEALLGSSLSRRVVSMDDILSNQTEFIKIYNLNLTQLRMNSEMLGLSALRNTLRDALDNMAKWDETNPDMIGAYNQHTKRIGDFIQTLDKHYLNEISRAVKLGVCNCIYPDTDVLTIINNIETIDPEGKQDINDVVALSIIDWLVDWFLTEQLTADYTK